MKEELVIKDLKKAKIISSEVRMQILEVLGEKKEASATEIAKELDSTPSKISYHLKLMEENGFIELKEQKMKGNLVEKFFAPRAKKIRVELGEKGVNQAGAGKILGKTLNLMEQDIKQGRVEKGSSISYRKCFLTQKEVQELNDLLTKKLDEFSSRKKKEDYLEYKVGLVMFKIEDED